jgi:hypothetical protein
MFCDYGGPVRLLAVDWASTQGPWGRGLSTSYPNTCWAIPSPIISIICGGRGGAPRALSLFLNERLGPQTTDGTVHDEKLPSFLLVIRVSNVAPPSSQGRPCYKAKQDKYGQQIKVGFVSDITWPIQNSTKEKYNLCISLGIKDT